MLEGRGLMKNHFRFLGYGLIMLFLTYFVSGCQIVDLLWPKPELQEIAELLPDEAQLSELEKAIEELESEIKAVEPEHDLEVKVSPITNSFTLH